MASENKMNKLNRKVQKGGLWNLLTEKVSKGRGHYFYNSANRNRIKSETKKILKDL